MRQRCVLHWASGAGRGSIKDWDRYRAGLEEVRKEALLVMRQGLVSHRAGFPFSSKGDIGLEEVKKEALLVMYQRLELLSDGG